MAASSFVVSMASRNPLRNSAVPGLPFSRAGLTLLAALQLALRANAPAWDSAGTIPAPVRGVAALAVPVWLVALGFGRFVYTLL